MYVGVILTKPNKSLGSRRIPHVCGGDPQTLGDGQIHPVYSPCMWG